MRSLDRLRLAFGADVTLATLAGRLADAHGPRILATTPNGDDC